MRSLVVAWLTSMQVMKLRCGVTVAIVGAYLVVSAGCGSSSGTKSASTSPTQTQTQSTTGGVLCSSPCTNSQGASITQVVSVPEIERSNAQLLREKPGFKCKSESAEPCISDGPVTSFTVMVKNNTESTLEVDPTHFELLDSAQAKVDPVNEHHEGPEAARCPLFKTSTSPSGTTSLGPREGSTFHVCFQLPEATVKPTRLILTIGDEIPLQ
jgi:hypothetical protein